MTNLRDKNFLILREKNVIIKNLESYKPSEGYQAGTLFFQIMSEMDLNI